MGVLNSLNSSTQYDLGHLLYTVAYCGVDLFTLISGFVGFSMVVQKDDSIRRWSRFLFL